MKKITVDNARDNLSYYHAQHAIEHIESNSDYVGLIELPNVAHNGDNNYLQNTLNSYYDCLVYVLDGIAFSYRYGESHYLPITGSDNCPNVYLAELLDNSDYMCGIWDSDHSQVEDVLIDILADSMGDCTEIEECEVYARLDNYLHDNTVLDVYTAEREELKRQVEGVVSDEEKINYVLDNYHNHGFDSYYLGEENTKTVLSSGYFYDNYLEKWIVKPSMQLDRIAVCEVYSVLLHDYNVSGMLTERYESRENVPYNHRAIAWQLHNMKFKARPNLSYDTLDEESKAYYDYLVMRYSLPKN